MRYLHVRLHAPARSVVELAGFYAGRLGVERLGEAYALGETRLELAPAAGHPFYHFALLVPGDRFAAALHWARARTELLPDEETGDVVFDFSNWDAEACYFHDPAANIVELIAHRGIGENGRSGAFSARELIGFSELGLVGDTAAMQRALASELHLELWDGTVGEEGRLGFVGEKARTLILCPPGRGWLPTGRPAEPHPAQVVLAGSAGAEARLEGGRYVLRGEAGAAGAPTLSG